MKLMIAAAKGARINTFICGQSLTDPGAPNGEVASLQIVRSKTRRQSHVGQNYLTSHHSIHLAQKRNAIAKQTKKSFKRSYELCGYSHWLGAW
jgi:hypothetical protein